jgi:hypothetical protein
VTPTRLDWLLLALAATLAAVRVDDLIGVYGLAGGLTWGLGAVAGGATLMWLVHRIERDRP